MKKVKAIGSYRGFINELFNSSFKNIEFIYSEENVFEIPSNKKKILIKIFNSKFFDFLGLFTTRKVSDTDFNYFFSYNRFLKAHGGKYVILLENPTALVNYSDTKMNSFVANYRLNKLFNDSKLLKIVCISEACYKGMNLFYKNLPLEKVEQVYPLIKDTNLENNELKLKSESKVLKCLFVSSQFILKGGEDILETFKHLIDKNIELTIVTDITKLSDYNKKEIDNNLKIKLVDFKLSRKELFKLYRENNILLNPSRMDSFSLVTLEAVKNGCVVISSDIYAIKEIVIDGWNGFLTFPKYKYWNDDGSIDHYLKHHPESTYASNYIDKNMVKFLIEELEYLYLNRDVLLEMSLNSKNISEKKFGEKKIIGKWDEIFEE